MKEESCKILQRHVESALKFVNTVQWHVAFGCLHLVTPQEFSGGCFFLGKLGTTALYIHISAEVQLLEAVLKG